MFLTFLYCVGVLWYFMSGSVGLDFGLEASDADLIREFLVIYRTVEFLKGTVSRDGYFFEGLN
jgi:hypothetical protein